MRFTERDGINMLDTYTGIHARGRLENSKKNERFNFFKRNKYCQIAFLP